MKRVVVLASLLVLISIASAQMPDPGMITPKHGFLYQLDLLFDELKILLSPDKVAALTDVLNERLAEIKVSGGDPIIIADYQTKLQRLQDIVSQVDDASRQQIIAVIEVHKTVLEHIEEIVPENAKPAIRRAINESMRVRDVIEKTPFHKEREFSIKEIEKHANHTNGYSQLRSEIVVPQMVKVGQSVDIKIRIYNPFDVPIKPIIRIEAKKDGVLGWFIKRSYTYPLPVTIQPKQYYEKTITVTVPESIFGIPLTGTWEVEVEVIANGLALIEKEFTITIKE